MLVLTLLPATALAANATSVWIAGVELTGANPYYHNTESGAAGTANGTASDYNAYYNAATGVLTLNGLDVAGSTATKTVALGNGVIDVAYAVFADGDLAINLSGTNTISTAANAGGKTAIIALGVKGNLTVTGSGELTATGGNVTDTNNAQSNGIYAVGMLTVSGGTLNGTGGAVEAYYAQSNGVSAGELSVTDGSVTGNGGSAKGATENEGYGYSEGVYVNNTLRVSGGVLTATGGEVIGNAAESYGVYANTLNISGGTTNANGGKATGKNILSYSQGVGVYQAFTVSGGSLTATGGEAAVEADGEAYVGSYGIYAQADTITVSGGSLTATGGEAVEDSYGILNDGVYDSESGTYSDGAITVSGTAAVSATGGMVSGEDGNSYGIAVGTAAISGGTLIAGSGAAGGENADSYGFRCQGNSVAPALSITGGALIVTGGAADDDSYGIYADDGDVAISGGTLTVTGGEAGYRSYGVYAENADAAIHVSGGEFAAKSIDTEGRHYALNKALSRGPGVTAQGSTASDGSSPVDYADDDNATYLWVYVPGTPALVVEPSSAGVYTGGTVILTATPVNITGPAYRWYSNTSGATQGATAIDGATAATYTPPTTTAGTMYYYCVSGAVTSNIVSVTVTPSQGYEDTEYCLTFETNGGSAIPPITRAEGNTVDLTAYSTTRAGYTFVGWYADETLTTAVTSVKLTGNVTVYAKWIAAVLPFTDVTQNDWFYNDVAFVYAEGLMKGTGDSKFSPALSTSRGMVVTILYRMENASAISGECPFVDVRSGSYYEKAICWATQNKIVNGYGNGMFGPDDPISREQMAAILYRYACFKKYDVTAVADLTGFQDKNQISSYALLPLAWANAEGLVNGVGGKRLDPLGTATRAQVAAILHRFIEN